MRPCFELEKIDRRTDRQMTEIFLLCRSCHWHRVEKKFHDKHQNTCVIESIVLIKPASLCFRLYSIILSPNPFDVRPQRQKTGGGGGSKREVFFSRESISTPEQDTTSVNGKIHWCLVCSLYSHICYRSWTTSVEATNAE